MSTKTRKIAYWSIDFVTGEGHDFDADIFSGFIKYMAALSVNQRIIRDVRHNKATIMDSVEEQTKQNKRLLKIIFKSCKYNHSPAYMSSIDGSERLSDKQLFEGEKELTHLCVRLDTEEAYTVVEQRQNGVSMLAMMSYFNAFFAEFMKDNHDIDGMVLNASAIPSEGFLDALKHTERISVAELFVNKRVIGSEYLKLIDDEINAREEIVITVKSKPKDSLHKMVLEKLYYGITSQKTEVSRIRLSGKNDKNLLTRLDSMDAKKVEEVVVELKKDGTVDSYSIFGKLEEILGVTE